MKHTILWNVTPCVVQVHLCFGGTYCLNLQDQRIGQASAVYHPFLAWLTLCGDAASTSLSMFPNLIVTYEAKKLCHKQARAKEMLRQRHDISIT
jgi:hypothetical protein